jgi:hypothetical protein
MMADKKGPRSGATDHVDKNEASARMRYISGRFGRNDGGQDKAAQKSLDIYQVGITSHYINNSEFTFEQEEK